MESAGAGSWFFEWNQRRYASSQFYRIDHEQNKRAEESFGYSPPLFCILVCLYTFFYPGNNHNSAIRDRNNQQQKKSDHGSNADGKPGVESAQNPIQNPQLVL
jgi:hypothetical protein